MELLALFLSVFFLFTVFWDCVTSYATTEITQERVDCVWSDSTVRISGQIYGNSINLICTVDNKPVDSHVSWKKDGKRISRDSVREIGDSRITAHADFSSNKFVVQIDDLKPEDSGWYTCELTTNGKEAATAATKIEVGQLPTDISTSTDPTSNTNTTSTFTTTTTTTEATVPGDTFVEQDLVWVLSDKQKVKELAVGHGEWNDAMRESLGKIGRVTSVYRDGDLRVELCNASWIYNPKAVIKITSAGDSAPEISSNCVTSYATTEITQERVGNVVKLLCSVVNEPKNFTYVSWVKEGEVISREGLLRIRNPRIKIIADNSSAIHTLEIANMTHADAGWYTCELRNRHDKLAAVSAMQLNYQPNEKLTTSVSCVDFTALSSIREQLVDIKYLITNSTSELRSKLNDVSERLEIVEEVFMRVGDVQPAT